MAMDELLGKRIHITGIVQGVGFRPFVYGLAQQHGLTGWVRNTSAGVDIEVNGRSPALTAFTHALTHDAPPLAQIDSIEIADLPANGFTHFEIVHSTAVADAFQPISPDVSICPDCLREMLEPNDRRYLYPFINCTNCGPRFTIIQDIPYDRPATTMAPFEMCPACRAEYEDPLDRRFHAQPVACPACGPQVWLEKTVDSHQLSGNSEQLPHTDHRLPTTDNGSPIMEAQRLLAGGHILAIKGLGGFHLACDALNETAVATLRQRKLRRDKPFALMMPDLDTVRRHCHVSAAEADLLTSRQRPIVILRRRADSSIAPSVAPGQTTIGVMLPYTPLHYLLFHNPSAVNREPNTDHRLPITDSGPPTALVMTSGNLSEEPIAYTNADARARLSALADYLLLNNRDIHVRCDDSVMRIIDLRLKIKESDAQSSIIHHQSSIMPLRRSRGYAPFPVRLPWDVPPLLGAGAELKNTFCLTNGRYAFLSHHIGDMENMETLQSFEEGVAHFEKLFRVTPQAIAYDLHPNYLASRYALDRAAHAGIPAIGVQHHHAHIAAVMAEHGLSGDRTVIGVSFDGTGYGEDGAIWGGEFLVADYVGFERPYHLTTTPLPGGDKAVKEPWRLALTWLHHASIDWTDDLPPTVYGSQITDYGFNPLDALKHQLTTGLNAPPTTSMGRLFDAVAALIGVRQTVNYEGQAAIELEALADPTETNHYPFTIHNSQFTIDIAAIVNDLRQNVPIPTIAARFHNGVAQMVVDVCTRINQSTGLTNVALSGGVWQNVTLLTRTIPRLQTAGFTVYWHEKVPPNDGGLALGQTAVAAARLK